MLGLYGAAGHQETSSDTTSFQAPDFYKRHEYIEHGRIEGYPPGHTRLWLMKRL